MPNNMLLEGVDRKVCLPSKGPLVPYGVFTKMNVLSGFLIYSPRVPIIGDFYLSILGAVSMSPVYNVKSFLIPDLGVYLEIVILVLFLESYFSYSI